MSPSSRRAWIEISWKYQGLPRAPVALLAEGVDRNLFEVLGKGASVMSPSSRRAWIEIAQYHITSTVKYTVALLAEGVDRNTKRYSD